MKRWWNFLVSMKRKIGGIGIFLIHLLFHLGIFFILKWNKQPANIEENQIEKDGSPSSSPPKK